METINDVLHFLNKLVFVAYLEGSDYEKLNCIEEVLANEFEDVDSENLINMLDFIDYLYILFLTHNFQDVQVLTSILSGNIFQILKIKNE